MPFVLLIVGAFVVFAVLSHTSRGQGGKPPPNTQTPAKTTTPSGSTSEVQKALNFAADKLVESAFSTKEAKAVAKFGLALAISVGVVNIAAGVIILVAVLFIANIVEFVAQLTQGDNHQVGIDRYWEQYAQIKTTVTREIESAALVKNQTVDAMELEYASTAYADGFMRWQNQLTIWRAWQGAVYGPGISGGVQWSSAPNATGMAAIQRAWKQGLYAGTQAPANLDYESQAQLATNIAAANIAGFDGPAFLEAICDFFHPPGQTDWQRSNESVPANVKAICTNWYKIGKLHANAGGFASSLQAPVGAGQTLYSHMVNSAINGFYQGKVLQPPDVPSNLGVGFLGTVAYTPDNKTAVFTKTGQ